jgi:Na+/H+ antiporter NhaD/arsenite permease-like protein
MGDESDMRIDVLSQHYSETFMLLKEDVKKRDRLIIYILINVFLILIYMNAPTVVGDLINSFVGSRAGNLAYTPASKMIDESFIGTVLWFGLLCTTHTYFQTVLHIERQWSYLYKLENQLSRNFNNEAFIREGKYYKEHPRKFSSWTKFIFWVLFPLLLLTFIVFWLFFLFKNPDTLVGYKVIDSLISVSIVISICLYLWALHRKK